MTFIKRLALAALVAGISSFGSQSYAFMSDSSEVVTAEGSADLTTTVDGLRQELKADATECDVMLGKIDAAIAQVDEVLDKGVVDEKKYLGLRDELVEMRLSLPCLANVLTQDGAPVLGSETILSDRVISETPISGPIADTGIGGMTGGAGGVTGVGGAGAGGLGTAGAGAAGIGPLAIGGIVAGVVTAAATSGDDPGTPASPSTP